jgi:hypothetical protein
LFFSQDFSLQNAHLYNCKYDPGSDFWIAQWHSSKGLIESGLNPAKFFFKKIYRHNGYLILLWVGFSGGSPVLKIKKSCLEKVNFRLDNRFWRGIRLNKKSGWLILIEAQLRSIIIRTCYFIEFLSWF